MKIDIIASGSKGNCTAVYLGKVTILLDAGIGFKSIQRALNFENPTACLITHEHGDHAKISTISELLKRGTDVYLTKDTAEALKLENSHRLHLIEVGTRYEIADLKFFATSTFHDAAAPVMFSIGTPNFIVRYIVDTGEIPLKVAPADYLLIETNYLENNLADSQIDPAQKERISKNHLSIEKVLHWLKRNCFLERPKEIHLIHISKRHGNADFFRQMVQNAVGENVKVFAH